MFPQNTLPSLFIERCQKSGTDMAVGWIEGSELHETTYQDYRREVESLTLALRKHGLQPQEKVAIISGTRREWNLFDLAIMSSRGVTIPVYPSYLADEVEYIIKHSESCMTIVEDEAQLAKVTSVLGAVPKQKLVATIKPVSDEAKKKFSAAGGITLRSFAELQEEGAKEMAAKPKAFEELVLSAPKEDLATIIYTSGTTGTPKGAVITQYALACSLRNVLELLHESLGRQDTILTYLPLSHVFGRQDSLLILIFGWRMVYAESLEKLVPNIAMAKPTVMAVVPRVLEKIYAGITKQVENGPALKRAIFNWSVGVAREVLALTDAGGTPGGFLALKHKIANALVFSKIQQKFGGKLRYFISGSAPLSVDILQFLRAIGLSILEGYGLTETLSGCCINLPSRQIPGTVGKAFPNTEIKIAEDGEILIKGDALFSGYYKSPEATAESLKDGWLYTGDIGEFTPEGFLKITDRKKDLIKTSGGKYIIPQRIEGMVKAGRWVSQIVVIGDKRNFVTALIGVDKEKLKDTIPQLGLNADCRISELASHPKLREMIQGDITEVNKKLAKYETIKRFHVCAEEFTIDGGLLTPSLKVKKKVAIERYKAEIDGMYAGAGSSTLE